MSETKTDIINKLLIPFDTKIIDALKEMDRKKRKLLIIEKNDKYYSLLSIGDIQRAIINNTPLDNPVINIVRKKEKIKIASTTDSFGTIKKTMINFKIEFMPIVDKHNKIKDIYFWEDITGDKKSDSNSELSLIPVVIMAGGKGTRLKPLTNIIPKALVPIGDKPILQIIIEKFRNHGSSDFYISVNYKHEMIKQFFETQITDNYDIKYILEGIPLGTAGSLQLLTDDINTTFFVSNCDIIVDQDYSEVLEYHRNNKNEITIISAIKNIAIPYGTLETGKKGALKSIKEKPDITIQVNTGMYILEPHLISEIPEKQFFHITTLIENIKRRGGKIGVFPVSEKSWIDIGEWKNYQQLFSKSEN